VSGGGRFSDPWHPFGETSAALAAALRDRGCEVSVSEDADAALAGLGAAPLPSLLVLNIGWYGPDRFTDAATEGLVAALQAGLPTMVVHSTLTAFPEWPLWREIAGGGWTYGTTYHPDYGPGEVEARPGHPVSDGLDRLDIVDERYTDQWVDDACAVYLEHEEEGRRHPLAWTRTWGASPILADSLGHDAGSYRAPGRALLLQRELDWLLPAA
jgi:type 1 glutamine amidotransferase